MGGNQTEVGRSHQEETPPAPTNDKIRKRNRRQRGQSLVELALAIPLFFILVFGIVDFGLALKDYITVTNSVREGARFGIVCNSDSAIQGRVHDYSDDLIDTSDVSVAWKDADTNAAVDPCTTGSYLEVTAKYQYAFITPLGSFIEDLSGPLTLSSATRMRVE